jgi:3-deoxy-D-manno-octulosonate 8-phosphate phosphatase (KDO 8-P phosphatase)
MPLASHLVVSRARRIRLLLLDVDGVLTDGSIQIGPDGREAKTFFVRDGTALVWARREGLQVGLLSGRTSEATTRRAAELGLDPGFVAQGEADKSAAFRRLTGLAGVGADEAAYMGDDLLDVPVLREAGLSGAPADAVDEVRAAADWVSARPGGRGAVREFVELVLGAQGRWGAVAAAYLAG